MEKKAPTALQGLVIVGFVLSCFGLALLLWISFGGPTPLRPQSYEIKVPVREATQLAEQSDVRISGVNVGKVANIDLPPAGGEAIATLSIDERFAPLPADIKATLRAKTLLGETYIELTPGTADGPQLAEGATLPAAQVAPTIQLDEILRTFDPKTRAALRTWLRDSAIAIDGRGPRPLQLVRAPRADVLRLRQDLPHARHAGDRRSASCSPTARPPSTRSAAGAASCAA